MVFVRGDRVTWHEKLNNFDNNSDALACFIRGQADLDLTGVPNGDGWDFTITEAQSQTLVAGYYKAQFVIFGETAGRQTISTINIQVRPSLEHDGAIVDPERAELEEITRAIATLSRGGIAEYQIKGRRVTYHDLNTLVKRQEYLRRRLAIRAGKIKPGGTNQRIRFGNF